MLIGKSCLCFVIDRCKVVGDRTHSNVPGQHETYRKTTVFHGDGGTIVRNLHKILFASLKGYRERGE